MSATCSACGVAVVPGYVRCPKCQAPLQPPRAARSTQNPANLGGTVLDAPRAFPVLSVLGGLVVLGGVVAAVLALRGGASDTAPRSPVAAPAETDAADTETGAAPTTGVTAAVEPDLAAPAGPDPQDAAAALATALKRQRLWSTVDVIGTRVDVRTGACGDPAMAPTLDAAIAPLKAAGMVKLRCLAKSGTVELERDL